MANSEPCRQTAVAGGGGGGVKGLVVQGKGLLDMVVSMNGGPQNGPQNTVILNTFKIPPQ